MTVGRTEPRRRWYLPPRSWGELLHNRVLTHVPWNELRVAFLKILGMSAGPNTYLFGGVEVMEPDGITIEGNCHVGRFTLLDGRGGLRIGRNVVIAGRCVLSTADHDPQTPDFEGRVAPIQIGDRAWLATGCTVLRGVQIGAGAVVCSGAVVTKDVAPWAIVGGVPAAVIGQRNRDQHYEIDYGPSFF